ncbi:hypothetical protein SAMN04487948_12433 [Halogranum amylolyticum]|uniref:TraC-like domain-containing protein n=1 Tax=Halogranum amylolyticum TaxID=660520 RepID=A0A1H8W6F4_9EURY|nr:hypothetical protein [Halogranum amylolyticum]SEP23189.1 hypothetical protein SAMN04487948_12433 [Halogranum amylolyticum]
MTGLGPRGDDPERRILDDVGSNSGFLAFTDVSNADLLFLVPVLIIAMITLEAVVIVTGRFFVGVALALAVLTIAGVYVHVCPDHRTPLGLITSFVTHHRRENTMTFTNTTTETGADTPPDARELTHVRAVEPEADAIRRQDETLVGAVRIDPANLALADQAQWDRAARGLGAVLNTLDYPVQVHSSARRVDPARMTAAYDDRRTDPDVRATPALTEIVEVYRRRRPQEFHERGTSVRQYHAIVTVGIQEVSLEDNGWVRRLQSVPLIGDHVGSVVADVLLRDERREAIEERQRAILRDRRTHFTEQLTSIEGVTARPVTATDLVTLVEEYWSGNRTEYPDAGPHLRTTPVVMSDHDTDVSHSPTDTTTSSVTRGDRA